MASDIQRMKGKESGRTLLQGGLWTHETPFARAGAGLRRERSSHLIALGRPALAINVRDARHAPAQGGAHVANSEAHGPKRVLRHPDTPCLVERGIPEQLLHATVAGSAFLACTMVAERNIGGSGDWIVSGLDIGYLAGKTI